VTDHFTFNPIELLDVALHNRKTFSCGVEVLDIFIQQKARRESPELSRTFVLTCSELPGEIFGYYSLSATRLSSNDLPDHIKKKIGQYGAIPATLLSRLSTSSKYQNSKLRVGETLLIDAIHRSYRVSHDVASYGIVVDILKSPTSDPTKFYERYGFCLCVETPGRAYLPMHTVKSLLERAELI